MAIAKPLYSPPPTVHCLIFTGGDALFRPQILWRKSKGSLFPISVKVSSRVKCLTKSTEEREWSESETLTSNGDGDDTGDEDNKVQESYRRDNNDFVQQHSGLTGSPRITTASSSDSLSLGIREPVYEVIEVKSSGLVSTRKINRRHLLKSSGLRPRDIRSVDPSLWLTNSMPSLLVREHAILLNLGSLRAIAMQERVLIFNYNRKGGKAFIDTLLPRLNPRNTNGGPSMPFVIEVVEAALNSRTQRLERRLMDLEPRVSMGM
ncbi:hypothetical protein CsSME_00040590 [Camellia sinensis var. sinensis]